MICYKKLDIPNHRLISDKLFDYVTNRTQILDKKIFWNYVRVPQVFESIPELKELTEAHNLNVSAMAVIYAPPGLEGAIHIDYGLDVRILWPIRNCEGSYTRFFDIDKQYIQVARLPNNEPYYKITKPEPYEVIDELELTQPVVFDSGIAHGVYTNPNCNEPRLTFTIRCSDSMKHWLS